MSGLSDTEKKWEKEKFQDDMGQKAKVERQAMSNNEMTAVCDETLQKIGVMIGQADPSVRHLTYLGSAAVHVYGSYAVLSKDGTPQLAFFGQTGPLGTMNELVAGAAGQDLLKAIARRYGRKAPTKRSGF